MKQSVPPLLHNKDLNFRLMEQQHTFDEDNNNKKSKT